MKITLKDSFEQELLEEMVEAVIRRECAVGYLNIDEISTLTSAAEKLAYVLGTEVEVVVTKPAS